MNINLIDKEKSLETIEKLKNYVNKKFIELVEKSILDFSNEYAYINDTPFLADSIYDTKLEEIINSLCKLPELIKTDADDKKIASLKPEELNPDSYEKLLDSINNAKHEIFIDNQFFSLDDLTNILIKKKNNDNINIYILTNGENASQESNEIESIITKSVVFFSIDYIYKLKNNGIKFVNTNKYTHNKICVVDKKYLLMGSMNLMERSVSTKGDKEMCVFLENKEICNNLLAYYQDTFSYETI
jgi:phosphatidylserine/phosphatidylglycerophosphate/cardiolipin synthase-like enzyme